MKGLRVFWDAEKRETSRSECRYVAQESVNGGIRSCVGRGNMRCIQAVIGIDRDSSKDQMRKTQDESLESLLTTRRAKLVFGDQATMNP